MASYREKLEGEIKAKFYQKDTPHKGFEQVLMQAFKYLDLDNSGAVDLQEFVDKVGVVIESLCRFKNSSTSTTKTIVELLTATSSLSSSSKLKCSDSKTYPAEGGRVR